MCITSSIVSTSVAVRSESRFCRSGMQKARSRHEGGASRGSHDQWPWNLACLPALHLHYAYRRSLRSCQSPISTSIDFPRPCSCQIGDTPRTRKPKRTHWFVGAIRIPFPGRSFGKSRLDVLSYQTLTFPSRYWLQWHRSRTRTRSTTGRNAHIVSGAWSIS